MRYSLPSFAVSVSGHITAHCWKGLPKTVSKIGLPFDEDQNLIVAWSWTYDFLNESKFENDIKNKKLIDIQTELVTPGWNTILEDELKAESKYNKMVYFKT